MTDEVLQSEEDLNATAADEADVMKDFNFDDILENPADANVTSDDASVEQPLEEMQPVEPIVAPEDIFMSTDVVADVTNENENVVPEINVQPEVVDFSAGRDSGNRRGTERVDADLQDNAADGRNGELQTHGDTHGQKPSCHSLVPDPVLFGRHQIGKPSQHQDQT